MCVNWHCKQSSSSGTLALPTYALTRQCFTNVTVSPQLARLQQILAASDTPRSGICSPQVVPKQHKDECAPAGPQWRALRSSRQAEWDPAAAHAAFRCLPEACSTRQGRHSRRCQCGTGRARHLLCCPLRLCPGSAACMIYTSYYAHDHFHYHAWLCTRLSDVRMHLTIQSDTELQAVVP